MKGERRALSGGNERESMTEGRERIGEREKMEAYYNNIVKRGGKGRGGGKKTMVL